MPIGITFKPTDKSNTELWLAGVDSNMSDEEKQSMIETAEEFIHSFKSSRNV